MHQMSHVSNHVMTHCEWHEMSQIFARKSRPRQGRGSTTPTYDGGGRLAGAEGLPAGPWLALRLMLLLLLFVLLGLIGPRLGTDEQAGPRCGMGLEHRAAGLQGTHACAGLWQLSAPPFRSTTSALWKSGILLLSLFTSDFARWNLYGSTALLYYDTGCLGC